MPGLTNNFNEKMAKMAKKLVTNFSFRASEENPLKKCPEISGAIAAYKDCLFFFEVP
jgi:hypothetical protein